MWAPYAQRATTTQQLLRAIADNTQVCEQGRLSHKVLHYLGQQQPGKHADDRPVEARSKAQHRSGPPGPPGYFELTLRSWGFLYQRRPIWYCGCVPSVRERICAQQIVRASTHARSAKSATFAQVCCQFPPKGLVACCVTTGLSYSWRLHLANCAGVFSKYCCCVEGQLCCRCRMLRLAQFAWHLLLSMTCNFSLDHTLRPQASTLCQGTRARLHRPPETTRPVASPARIC